MMADFLEKTLSSLPVILVGNSSRGAKDGTSSSFRCFVNAVRNLKSKHEERSYVHKVLVGLKKKLSQPSQSLVEKKECLIQLIFCQMLGYDVSFGFIHALKLAQQGLISEKRTGYLACSLLLHEEHELVTLLVNTLLRDLSSSNVLAVSTALVASSQLISSDMVPALLPHIQGLISHPREFVRIKVVMCLHKFVTRTPGLESQIAPMCRNALSDSHPSVVGAALHIYSHLVKGDVESYFWLVEVLLGILGQIVNRQLPSDCEYHTVPAPWITINILRLLAILGHNNTSASNSMYGGLSEVLTKTETSHKIGLAIIYECLVTITTIEPHPSLLELAAKCVSKFLAAKNVNLKYLGMKALSSLVAINASYAMQHQGVVMDCLQHPDSILKNKTLELLFCMANPSNVEVICHKQLEHFTQQTNQHQRQKLVLRVIHLCDRYRPSIEWYVSMMNKTLVVAGELVPASVCQKLVCSIQNGIKNHTGEMHTSSDEERIVALRMYWNIMNTSLEVTPTLLQVAAWVLGEYCLLVRDPSPSQVIDQLVHWFKETSNTQCHLWILSALIKLYLYIEKPSELIAILTDAVKDTRNKDIAQRLKELERLCTDGSSLRVQFNPGQPCLNDQVDFSLSFLDGFVSDALEKGSQPYNPHLATQVQQHLRLGGARPLASLQFTPYQQTHHQTTSSSSSSGGGGGGGRASGISPDASLSSGTSNYTRADESSVKLKVTKRVWGHEGVGDACLDKNETPPSSEDTGIESTQVPENHKSNEEDHLKHDLASALFSGITSPGYAETEPHPELIDIKDSSETHLSPDPINQPISDVKDRTANQVTNAFNFPQPGSRSPDAASSDNISKHSRLTCSVSGEEMAEDNVDDPRLTGLQGHGVSEAVIGDTGANLLTFPPEQGFNSMHGSLPTGGRLSSEDSVVLSDSMAGSEHCVGNGVEGSCQAIMSTVQTPAELDQDSGNWTVMYTDETVSVKMVKVAASEEVELQILLQVLSGKRQESHIKILTSPALMVNILQSDSDSEFHLPVLEAGETHLVKVVIKNNHVFTAADLNMELITEESCTPLSVHFDCADWVRGCELSLDEYGALWEQYGEGVRGDVKLNCLVCSDDDRVNKTASVASVIATVNDRLRFHPTHQINDEALFAGRMIGGETSPILLHCKLHRQAKHYTAWFKSPSHLECVLPTLNHMLQQATGS